MPPTPPGDIPERGISHQPSRYRPCSSRRGFANMARAPTRNSFSPIRPTRSSGPFPTFPANDPRSLYPPLAFLRSPTSTPSLLSPDANYGRHREMLPTPVEEFLFEQGQIGDVVSLAIAAFTLLYLAGDATAGPPLHRSAPHRSDGAPTGLRAVVVRCRRARPHRGVVLAVSLRIALWLLAALSIDRLLGNLRDKPEVPAMQLAAHRKVLRPVALKRWSEPAIRLLLINACTVTRAGRGRWREVVWAEGGRIQEVQRS